jgi:hypothetical protein
MGWRQGFCDQSMASVGELGFWGVEHCTKISGRVREDRKVSCPSPCVLFFLVYIHLLSAGSLTPCTLKELGMWLDLGALKESYFLIFLSSSLVS